MGGAFKHKDVGVRLEREEWEAEDTHQADGQRGGDFISYNVLTGLWEARKLVDADIPAAIARDTEVATAVSDHADLDTDVHRVGANYIPQAPAGGHLLRSFTKGWTTNKVLIGQAVDADPIERVAMLLEIPAMRETWLTDPASAASPWTVAYLGSGNINDWAPMRIDMSTGATINSATRVYAQPVPSGPHKYSLWLTQWAGTARTDSTVWLGVWKFAGWTVPPTLTQQHLGFKIIDGAIYATSADGTTEEATPTGITYDTAWRIRLLMIDHEKGVSCKFYVDNVLKATHTTNVPDFGAAQWWHSITNQVAANRELMLKGIHIISSAA